MRAGIGNRESGIGDEFFRRNGSAKSSLGVTFALEPHRRSPSVPQCDYRTTGRVIAAASSRCGTTAANLIVAFVVIATAMVIIPTSARKKACAQAGSKQQRNQRPYQRSILHVYSSLSGRLKRERYPCRACAVVLPLDATAHSGGSAAVLPVSGGLK